MRSVLFYTSARLGIFVATTAVLWLTPLRKAPIFLLLGALVISGVISYVLLSTQRDAMSATIVNGVRDKKSKLEDSRGKED
ncbi:DUF4229 domain-containing protein [Actinomadura harenae]|uniref:DUF4229 domain-containing protein n=1 Tax=Actinomadura harenae TaxID=2483351 RepID=A0A3M2MFM2_9ACTN|nr:DUF4229 domain-containing protein [Actinomadura harenae]RMI47663.1 DUF4229 domain-containing protein [Actinomadura harenae]